MNAVKYRRRVAELLGVEPNEKGRSDDPKYKEQLAIVKRVTEAGQMRTLLEQYLSQKCP